MDEAVDEWRERIGFCVYLLKVEILNATCHNVANLGHGKFIDSVQSVYTFLPSTLRLLTIQQNIDKQSLTSITWYGIFLMYCNHTKMGAAGVLGTHAVADLEGGRAGSAPPHFERRTDAVTHDTPDMWQGYYIMATPSPFLCLEIRKTWYSEYSKWLPPVALWQLYSAPHSFSAGALPRTPLGSLYRSPKPHS